jgi:hypothetical protein
MPKLAQWAEDNIPEGLTVFALDLCGFTERNLLNPYLSMHTKDECTLRTV